MLAANVFRDIVNNKPRNEWFNNLKPYIYKITERSILLYDSEDKKESNLDEFMITEKELSENYRSPFNIGDIVLYNDCQWVVISYPMLDNRNSLEFIKSKDINIAYEGAYLEIVKADQYGNPKIEKVTEQTNGFRFIEYHGFSDKVKDSDLVLIDLAVAEQGAILLSDKIKNHNVTINLD